MLYPKSSCIKFVTANTQRRWEFKFLQFFQIHPKIVRLHSYWLHIKSNLKRCKSIDYIAFFLFNAKHLIKPE